jgi:hypothetical protein
VADPVELEALTTCFAQRVAAWFENEGRAQVSNRVYLRQMNMAIALAASRWNEFADADDAVASMQAWFGEVERRAVERNAQARVDAIRQARAWFDACTRNP